MQPRRSIGAIDSDRSSLGIHDPYEPDACGAVEVEPVQDPHRTVIGREYFDSEVRSDFNGPPAEGVRIGGKPVLERHMDIGQVGSPGGPRDVAHFGPNPALPGQPKMVQQTRVEVANKVTGIPARCDPGD